MFTNLAAGHAGVEIAVAIIVLIATAAAATWVIALLSTPTPINRLRAGLIGAIFGMVATVTPPFDALSKLNLIATIFILAIVLVDWHRYAKVVRLLCKYGFGVPMYDSQTKLWNVSIAVSPAAAAKIKAAFAQPDSEDGKQLRALGVVGVKVVPPDDEEESK